MVGTRRKAAEAIFTTEMTIAEQRETKNTGNKVQTFDVDQKSVTSIVCGNESVFLGRGVKSVEITFSDNVR